MKRQKLIKICLHYAIEFARLEKKVKVIKKLTNLLRITELVTLIRRSRKIEQQNWR